MRLVPVVLCFAAIGAAQTPTATLVGRVEDASGASIVGAAITVRNVETGEIRTARSQADGEFTVPNLRPGGYEVNIESAGFRSLRETALKLQVDQTARLDARLQVGAVAETVEVKADVPLLNTENGSRGDVISGPELSQMPLEGRDFTDLAFMVVGVQPAEQGQKGAGLSANGARADSSNVIIDGFNNQNARDAGAQVRPPLDALHEFKMQTSGYSAEHGRLAGGVMNMALKTGGNQWHGSLFEFLRNDLLDARNFFDPGKSKLRRNQFGGTLSGPVLLPRLYSGRDRTFFVASWESYRQVEGSTELGIVPTALEQQGDFSQSRDARGGLIPLRDPLASGSCTAASAAACFAGNRIPAARLSPVSLRLLPFYPLPNRPGANNHVAGANDRDGWDSFLFKADHKLTEHDNVSFRVLRRNNDTSNPFGGSVLGAFGGLTGSAQTLLGLSWVRLFSPAAVNEFRAGLTRTASLQLGVHQGRDYAAELGITGTTTEPGLIGFPRVTITGLATLGENASTPIQYTVNSYQWADTLTWVKPRHTVKMGFDILRVQFFQPTNTNFRGTFAFQNRWTGVPFGDFLLGLPNTTSRRIGTATNYIFTSNYGFFVQDDYKLTPNLTLNLGLRYELQKPPYEKHGQMTNYVPEINKLILAGDAAVPNLGSLVAGAGLTGLVGLARDHGLPFALVNTNSRDLAPRFGFAWRPFGGNATVVRGGYGIFFTGSRLNPIRTDLTGGFPFSLSQTFNRQPSNPGALTFSNPFPAALASIQGVTSTNGYEVAAPSQYLQSWNLTIERDLGGGVALEAGYAGSKGTHLGRKYDINQAYRLPHLQLPNGSYPKPIPNLNTISYYAFGSNSSYNAGTLSLRKRLVRSLFFRVNYVYAKSIDPASGLNYAGDGGFASAQDARNLNSERGRSDFDIRHAMSMNFTSELPFGRSRLAKGWQIAGTGRMYSGQPYTPQTSIGNISLGEPTRPDRIARGTLHHPGPEGWFAAGAFPLVPFAAFRFGNSGRNILDGPGFAGLNLSLTKKIPVRERGEVQFRWEVFNISNHTNFELPNVDVDVSNAATITGARPARVMQLSLRYQF